MAKVKRWTVDVYIDEHAEERRTYAEARLHSGDPTDVRGIGTSWRHPRDAEIPEIGTSRLRPGPGGPGHQAPCSWRRTISRAVTSEASTAGDGTADAHRGAGRTTSATGSSGSVCLRYLDLLRRRAALRAR